MKVEELVGIIGADFYTGVPDSQLKALCNYLINTYGIDKKHHLIAANEGNCVGLAAGYHLATGKVPVVYMQNSGEGNIINPVASLLNEKVYGIPMIFIIGWRGEPGVHDEPQHIYQGEVTLKLLEDMGIEAYVIDKDTGENDLRKAMERFKALLSDKKDVAFVVKKGALSYDEKVKYENGCPLVREEIIRHIETAAGEEPIVSTTGKASRELFEIREARGKSHKYDFLTVGSMGHSSSIALGIAINKPDTRIWCIDGDGAMLMHMGALGVIGSVNPDNLVHIVINNGAHETVGGMPTVAGSMDVIKIAEGCGYKYAVSVDAYDALDRELERAKAEKGLRLIEVKCGIGARDDLGRPTTTARENKDNFMDYLKGLC
ncbi:MAG: phosphonopyruvate decarboxylase [Lachnospiraceae bacterium]|nr:phosphonopyruvate decarboxylase [Lachnospiraceae bacterium]